MMLESTTPSVLTMFGGGIVAMICAVVWSLLWTRDVVGGVLPALMAPRIMPPALNENSRSRNRFSAAKAARSWSAYWYEPWERSSVNWMRTMVSILPAFWV